MDRVPNDIIFSLEAPGHWVAYNVFTRTSLGIDDIAMNFIGVIGILSKEDIRQFCNEKKARIWEIGYFSNCDGLLADPTRRLRDINQWPKAVEVDGEQLLRALKENWIVIEDEEDYRKRFALKQSLLDRNNFGNFHQQLGQELLLERRKVSGEWWVKQKFSDDFKSLGNTLYSAIQGRFLKEFFSQKVKPGLKILDVGCGIGFYSNMMAQSGADVLGVDPNETYIGIAQRTADHKANFKVCDVGKSGAFDFIEDKSFDIVFMSDALLFYFVSPVPEPVWDIQILFNEIKRVLKPTGCFYSVEPHYTFWLAPWLGDIEHPFTILTEYLERKYLVTPAYSQLIKAFAKAGFAITNMEEMLPDDNFKKVDTRAYHFAKQFPLWHLFELKYFGE